MLIFIIAEFILNAVPSAWLWKTDHEGRGSM
jgi:hypothetical protein